MGNELATVDFMINAGSSPVPNVAGTKTQCNVRLHLNALPSPCGVHFLGVLLVSFCHQIFL